MSKFSGSGDVRTALVTGGGQGIGEGIVRRLARDGYRVIVADIDVGRADTVAADVGGVGVELDVSDEAAVRGLAASVDRLDALVNNAAIFPGATLPEVDVAQFRRVMDVNVLGALLTTQAFLEHLTAAPGAAVVNIASTAAKVAAPGTGVYSPAKAAVVSLTKLCAIELGSLGIRFNAVAPGGVATAGADSSGTAAGTPDGFRDLLPLGHRGEPAEIADVVQFLLGNDARYVTGQVLYVDGGLSESTMTFFRAAQAR